MLINLIQGEMLLEPQILLMPELIVRKSTRG
jgi:DNA-binding LacI/PurR family transcriptional regulator